MSARGLYSWSTASEVTSCAGQREPVQAVGVRRGARTSRVPAVISDRMLLILVQPGVSRKLLVVAWEGTGQVIFSALWSEQPLCYKLKSLTGRACAAMLHAKTAR